MNVGGSSFKRTDLHVQVALHLQEQRHAIGDECITRHVTYTTYRSSFLVNESRVMLCAPLLTCFTTPSDSLLTCFTISFHNLPSIRQHTSAYVSIRQHTSADACSADSLDTYHAAIYLLCLTHRYATLQAAMHILWTHTTVRRRSSH